MVIGDGDIAKVLPRGDEKLFFASGVSNSQSTSERQYDKEVKLLLDQDDRKHIVYFSSLAIFYSDTRYTQHKRYMELLIRENFPRWTIIRIGNIDWGSNPHTLINYLRSHPKARVRDEYRYVVSKDEFLHWIGQIPEWSCEMNVPGRRLKVSEVKDEYVTKQA